MAQRSRLAGSTGPAPVAQRTWQRIQPLGVGLPGASLLVAGDDDRICPVEPVWECHLGLAFPAAPACSDAPDLAQCTVHTGVPLAGGQLIFQPGFAAPAGRAHRLGNGNYQHNNTTARTAITVAAAATTMARFNLFPALVRWMVPHSIHRDDLALAGADRGRRSHRPPETGREDRQDAFAWSSEARAVEL